MTNATEYDIRPCFYCKKIPKVLQETFEGEATFDIRCQPCKNFTGTFIGPWREVAAVEWWNDMQDQYEKYAVPMEPAPELKGEK